MVVLEDGVGFGHAAFELGVWDGEDEVLDHFLVVAAGHGGGCLLVFCLGGLGERACCALD